MTMQRSTFTSPADGLELATYDWEVADPRAVVQVAHGLAEHSARYDRFARALNGAGYTVHACDHRGHGDSIAGSPGDFGAAGFDGLIADLAAYGAGLQSDLPLFLFAHSMGSFAAQSVLLTHSAQYAGVVLSGSTALDLLAAGLAQSEGPVGLEAFNAGFVNRTGYEWLSRDEAEVDLYVADELCGNTFTSGFFADLLGGLGVINDRRQVARVRRDLPILLVAGGADPVGDSGKGVRAVAAQYESVGVADVTCTIYPDARHEIFNETNRDDVTADVVRWLDAHLPA